MAMILVVVAGVVATILACALVRARREIRALKHEALMVRLAQVTRDREV